MNLVEYSKCDRVALADLVRRGEVSPTELAFLVLEADEKINPQIKCRPRDLPGPGRSFR